MRFDYAAIVLALLWVPAAQARVAALAIDPHAPTTIYAGTTYSDALPPGVYASRDGGATWSATPLAGIDVRVLAVDPTGMGTLYAGSAGGVFKTTDGATTWNPTALVFAVEILTVDLTTSPATLCATIQLPFGPKIFEASSTGGEEWGPADSCPAGASPVTIPSYATYAPQGNGGGVYKSTDGGTTWLARNAGLTDAAVLVIAVDPSTSGTLYAGTEHGGVFKSTDGACTWASSGLADAATVPRARPLCQDGPDAVGLACRLDLLSNFVRLLLPTTRGPGERLLGWSRSASGRMLEVAGPSRIPDRRSNALVRRTTHELRAFRRVAVRVGRHRLTRPLPDLADDVLADLRSLRDAEPPARVCR